MSGGGSLGLRTGSYGSLQQSLQNSVLQTQPSFSARKPSKMFLLGSREKEKSPPFICKWRILCRRRCGMLFLIGVAVLVCVMGVVILNKDDRAAERIENRRSYEKPSSSVVPGKEDNEKDTNISILNTVLESEVNQPPPPSPPPPPPRLPPPPPLPSHVSSTSVAMGYTPQNHPCNNFVYSPPPADRKRIGPRPCPVCYIPVEQAIASMPSLPSASPVLRDLTYVHEENPVKNEPHGGSEFGGYPTLKQRNDSFYIKESMNVHCGFVQGSKPGRQTGFDIDEADLLELEQPHDVIVASAIFGNYDIIQQPMNISEAAQKKVPFYMFIDEETEAYMRNSSVLDDSMRVGLWRIVLVHNIPYTDARRNGKVPKLLLHRLFPNVRYSIWIDGKLQLVKDPYLMLERFLWRQNATFAISRHYRRFDVFKEAEANKAAGKYDNASINYQIDFYKKEGLTPYSEAKLPITSDVPEGCVIIREHIPITNLFTCLWFNEVDRFTSRDQLSFSTVRDKIMSKVNWSINMFLDCERRNFVIQAYHRDLLEHMAPPAAPKIYPPPTLIYEPPAKSSPMIIEKFPPVKKTPTTRKRDKRPGSRRHRKVIGGV